MSAFDDLMIDVSNVLMTNKYSYTEVADMFGISVADVERIDEIMNGDQFDDSMDGDFDSAMASAGFGTDEDYGYYGE